MIHVNTYTHQRTPLLSIAHLYTFWFIHLSNPSIIMIIHDNNYTNQLPPFLPRAYLSTLCFFHFSEFIHIHSHQHMHKLTKLILPIAHLSTFCIIHLSNSSIIIHVNTYTNQATSPFPIASIHTLFISLLQIYPYSLTPTPTQINH